MMEPLIICPQCGLQQSYQRPKVGESLQCAHCQHILVKQPRDNNYPTLYLLVAALILYFPANYYPIMIMTYAGRSSETTIWGGVTDLYSSGMYSLAVLVFTVSILVPLVKILMLTYLILVAPYLSATRSLGHHRLLRFVDSIGPWSMLDVFLVAILVALVKLQDLARVEPGPGLVAFAGVVVLTLIGSRLFDGRLLWRDQNE